MREESYKKNAPGWHATKDDYRLIFRMVDGLWREITNNIPEYFNMVLADYLQVVDVIIPDGCKMMRIERDDELFFIREWGNNILIDYDKI